MTFLLCMLPLSLLFGWMVYRYDMYDKEPWYLLLLSMALGYGVFSGIGYLEDFSNSRLGFYGAEQNTAGQAAVAATHEELAKLLVVVAIALVFRKHFNDPIDGLIYGGFVGLGMAIEESIFYMQVGGEAPGLAFLGQEVIRIALHVLMGGMSGFGIGLVMERSKLKGWLAAAIAGFFAASMTIHFLWDYLCGIPTASGAVTPDMEMFLRVASVALMVTAMGVFAAAVVIGSRMSRNRFSPDSERRVWNWLPAGETEWNLTASKVA